MIFRFCLKNEIEKLVANLHHKKEHLMHMKSLKQAFHHRLVLTFVHRVIKFDKEVWLRSYISLDTELGKKCKK